MQFLTVQPCSPIALSLRGPSFYFPGYPEGPVPIIDLLYVTPKNTNTFLDSVRVSDCVFFALYYLNV